MFDLLSVVVGLCAGMLLVLIRDEIIEAMVSRQQTLYKSANVLTRLHNGGNKR